MSMGAAGDAEAIPTTPIPKIIAPNTPINKIKNFRFITISF